MKKNFQNPVYIILIIFSVCFANHSKACVDYHSSIWVSYEYDSSYSEILLRVNNMELFGGPQGAFCSCALLDLNTVLSSIYYVSFVDSGTVNPTAGFLPWTPSSNASTAWNNIQLGNWDGFLAEATANLITGHPVDLIIRASLPPGTTLGSLDSNIQSNSFSLGTDEYDINGDSLALSHNDISGLFYFGLRWQRPLSYFNNLDNTFTSLLSVKALSPRIKAFPNPFSHEVSFELNVENSIESQLFITDLGGRVVHNFLIKGINIGINQFSWKPHNLPSGVYLLQYRNDKALRVERLIYKR